MTRSTTLGNTQLLQRIAASLLPITRLEGRAERYELAQRMAHYAVPGFSAALFDDGKLVAAAAIGRIDARDATPIDVETAFQAASMSKVVAAFVALQLVADGVLSLDEDVNATLRSWRVPENDFTKVRPVTLRRILAHRAGLTVHGFSGHAAPAPLPSLPDVLSGRAANGPVFVDVAPDSLHRYSGGGTTIAQLLIEDVTGRAFADVAHERVFAPLGLERTTFAIPLPATVAANAAHRHDIAGVPTPEPWLYFPQTAAAGLWTTPIEYGRFFAEIRDAWHGRSALLDRESARAMLTRGYGDLRGLGPMVYGDGASLRFFHDGNNSGFHCAAAMYVDGGQGYVVMANGQQGPSLWREYVAGAADICRWPDYLEAPQRVWPMDQNELERFAGDYVGIGDDAGVPIRIRIDGDVLRGGVAGTLENDFIAIGPREFRSQRTPYLTRFDVREDGRVAGFVVLEDGDPLLRAARRERQ
jgi:CubicO group peptidase (beta-lactamase class C family)